MMILSDFTSFSNGNILKDAEFNILEYCTSKHNDSFLTFIENEKFINALLHNKNVKAVLCTKDISIKIINSSNIGVLVVDKPKERFHLIHNKLYAENGYNLNNYNTKIGQNCIINEQSYISSKNVTIGDNVIIEPFAYIGENVIIENDVIIRSNTRIGGRGFCFTKTNKEVLTVNNIGKVILKEKAEIFSFCHIANGIFPHDCTTIGKDTKLDSFVQVAHSSIIGDKCLIGSGCVISGYADIKDDVWIGPNSTISNRINIGENAYISLGSVVTKDVLENEKVTGNFAINHHKFIQNLKKTR